MNIHKNYNDILIDNINSNISAFFFIPSCYDYRTKRDTPIPLIHFCYFCKSEKFQYMYIMKH